MPTPPTRAREHQHEQEHEPDDSPAAVHHEAEDRRSPGGKVVYAAVLKEAKEELGRSTSALFWSGLAAGLSMGFSLAAQGLLRHHLPEAGWAPLVAKLGYPVGFLIVILGRQQLFTENTLTPMLPLFRHPGAEVLVNVLRLWGAVLVGNLLGALAFALVAAKTPAFDPAVRQEFLTIGREAMAHGFGTTLLRAIFAGWLIALLVWMLPYAGSAHWFAILALTWLIGVAHFGHVVAGAVDVFALAWAGDRSWAQVLGGFIVPVLIGNVIGGVTLVAAVNHAQVTAGE